METPAPKPSRFKKNLRRTVFVLAAFMTLVALFIAEEHWRGNRAWHNYKTAMEDKGERFDAARLIPPKVPDDKNFVACPYLAHVIANSPEKPGWTNIDSYLPKPFNGRHSAWPYGLSTDLIDWAEALQGGLASEKMDPAQAAIVVLDHLKICEPVLAELRAASLRRYCRFNIPYEKWISATNSQVFELELGNLAALKGLYRVLFLHAEAEMVADHSEEALTDINLMFRLDDGIKDEPLLISQLVRIACVAVLLQPIGEGLAERRWSDAQLHDLQERLAQTDLLGSTVRSLYGERDILSNPLRLGRAMRWLGWDRMEQLNQDRAFQEVLLPRINLAEREVNPAVAHACDLAMSNYPPKGAFIHHHIFATMMLPALFHASLKAATVQTDVDLLTVACALERYRLAEGTYPDQLEALQPRFIATLPHDIINGQPLKYRRTTNGKFVLYSVGWNMKDDGGVTATLPFRSNLPRPQKNAKNDGGLKATTEGRGSDPLQGDWVLKSPD